MDDVADRIRAYIREEVLLGDTTKSLENDTPLLDGILDSLALTQLVGFIEEEFDTEVDDADITSDNFRTVGDIERLVRSRMSTAS
ncbi:MAG TPA: acyl carrier protein [Actinomycetota bacterium]